MTKERLEHLKKKYFRDICPTTGESDIRECLDEIERLQSALGQIETKAMQKIVCGHTEDGEEERRKIIRRIADICQEALK